MNWWASSIRHVVIFGLVVSSALFSCEDPSELGLQLIPPNNNLGVVQVDIPLETTVIQLDSINTTNRGILMTGDYGDADFGQVNVQSFFRVLPPPTSPNIPAEVTFADSLRANLRYSYFYGDDFATPHQLSVHRLLEQLVIDTIYYSNNTTPFDPVSVLDTTFMVNEADSLLSLNLDSLKDELFTFLQTYEKDSANDANFLEQFKGFSFVTDASSESVLGFDPTALDSRITLYYTTSDTVVNTVTLQYSTYYNRIVPDFAGSNLDGIMPLMEFTPPDGRSYLQTGIGVVPKIDFQPYFDFLDTDTIGTVVINKAEIRINDLEALRSSIDPPLQMSFFYTDDTNEFLLTDTDPPFPNTIQTDGVYISATRNNADPFNLNSQSQRAQLDTADVSYQPEVTLFLQLVADGLITRQDARNVLMVPFSFVENPTSVRDFGRNLDRFAVKPEDLVLRITLTNLE